MGSRLDLQTLLESLLGSENVYFQPPSTKEMFYPCIVYQRSEIRTDHANNDPYNLKNEYTITVIDADPDSTIPYKIAKIRTARFNRHFTTENLNHDVFTLFY